MQSKTDATSKQDSNKLKAQQNYVVMLTVMSSSFLIILLLITTIYFIGIVIVSDTSGQHLDKLGFIQTLDPFLLLINCSMNFVFYALSGRMFREALAKAVNIRWRKRKQ